MGYSFTIFYLCAKPKGKGELAMNIASRMLNKSNHQDISKTVLL